MGVDLAQVGLEFSTQQLKEGETAALSTFDRVEKGALRTQGAVAGIGSVMADVATRSQATAQQIETLRAALLRQGLTADQVASAMQKMDASLVQIPPHLEQVAQATQTMGGHAQIGSMHLQHMGFAMTALASSAVGVPSVVGQVGYALANLGIGTVTLIGIVAGLAAIIKGYEALTKSAREAEKAQRDLVDAGLQLAEQNRSRPELISASQETRAQLEGQRTTQLRQLQDFQSQIHAANVELAAATAATVDSLPTALLKLTRAQGEAQTLAVAIGRTGLALLGYAGETARLEKEAADERRKQLRALFDLGQNNAIAIAKLYQDVVAEESALVAKALEANMRRLQDADKLNARERERLGLLLLQQTAIEAAERARARALAVPALDLGITPQDQNMAKYNPFGRTTVSPAGDLFSRDDAIALLGNARLKAQQELDNRIAAHAAQTSREIRRVFDTDLVELLTKGLTDWAHFFQALGGIAADAAKIIGDDIAFKLKEGLKVGLGERLLGGAAAGFGVGTAVGSPGLGAVGGAAAGFVASGGDPFGALAGAISGFVSGLLGSSAKANKAAEDMRLAAIAFGQSLADFVAIANPRGPLGDSLEALTRQAMELQKQAVAAQGGVSFGNWDVTKTTQADLQKLIDRTNGAAQRYLTSLLDIRKGYDAAILKAKELFSIQEKQFNQDSGVQILRLSGQEEQAARLELQYQQERAMADALKQGYAAATIAQLTYLQGLQTEALVKAQAAEAQRKLNEQIGIGLSLGEREAGVSGDPRVALTATRDRQLFEATTQREAGALSPENFQRTLAVITGEFNKAMQQLADDAAAAALAVVTFNRGMREDLAVRLLLAQGRATEADDLRVRLAQEREYAQALRDGADALTLAALAQVQAAESAQRLADAVAVEARATEDLTVRSLRASGRGGAADIAAQLFAQQKEIDDAIKAGMSAAFLNQLKGVQKQEREAADAARLAAQQAAFDQAFPTTTAGVIAQSATSVNLAVGVSESTANRMTGLLSSQLAYQASLPRIEVLLKEIVRLNRIIARLSGTDLAAVDEGLARIGTAADSNAGLQPGNV
jgi:hypothetical protein